MFDKCPYCYRPLETWTHDPLLLPNGSIYKWTSDTELIEESDITKRLYKGFSQIMEVDVIELQDELKILEIDNLPEEERTEFSPLNVDGIFQIMGKHIKEMRDSIEKLLGIVDYTLKVDREDYLKEYFNYDEDNNHIIHPDGDKIEWTDPITEASDLQNFQIKNIHIEDLRHYIQIAWIEKFNITSIMTYFLENKTLPPDYSINTGYSFTGDKGLWSLFKVISMSAAGTGNGSIITSGKSIDDGSGISTKLFLQGDLIANQSPGNPVSISLQPRIHHNLSPYFQIQDTSIISLDADTSLLYSGTGLNLQAYVECLVTFSNNNLILYSYGIHPGSIISYEINLSQLAFENLNRNLYNDYQSIYGVFPVGLSIKRIDIKLHSAVAYGGNQTITNQLSVDNIKIT